MTTNSSPDRRATVSIARTLTVRPRALLEQLVARRVAVAVLDALSVIDVEIGQRHRRAAAACALDRQVQRLDEHAAVGDPGQA